MLRHHICVMHLTDQIYFSTMGQNKEMQTQKIRNSLNMRSIFRCMMEGGYYPKYEDTYILFNIDENMAVVEYEEGILSIRIFFSIEEDAFDLFLEASNATMLESFIVKPAVTENMKNIMFSCEMICSNVREFRKFFPLGIHHLKEAVRMHKMEMKRLILAEKISSATISATEDTYIFKKGSGMVS